MKVRAFLKRILKVGLATYSVFSKNEMSVFSGYATLYLLMSLAPLFTLIVGTVYLLPEEYLKSFAELIINLFPNIPQIQDLVNELLAHIDPQTGTIVISLSLVTMLWSSSNAVNALQLGLMRISGTEKPAIRRRISALLYTGLFVILIPALLIFRVLRGSLENFVLRIADVLQMPEFAEAVVTILEDSGLITLAAMAFVVVLTYTFLQGHKRSLMRQLPGAVFTTVFWVLFSALFEWFISKFWTASSLYGSLASVFLTALWMKVIINILFIGACLNEARFILASIRADSGE